MNYLLGLDIGITSTRTIIIDKDGKILASSISGYKLITPKPGWAEQNPKDWWEATTATIKNVLSSSNISAKDIACIGLSGQMHGNVDLLPKN